MINKKYSFIILILSLTLASGFVFSLCSSPEAGSNNLLYLNHHDTVKYVGKETCRACHNDKFETFVETGMGLSIDDASIQKSAGNFNKHQAVYDKFSDFYYYPFFSNNKMYLMEFRLENGDTTHKRIEEISYIIGSGQHTNSHLINVNGYIFQAPITWYAQEKKWDLPPGFENGNNSRFSRVIGMECMSCHNALPDFDYSSENRFTHVPNGIDCERCHGPGELHVKEKLAGKIVDTATQIDYTIVNPKKLSWELQIDVCQRCHLQGNAILQEGKSFASFKPGMKLSEVMDIYMPSFSNDHSFIMASHAQRLQLSQCFIKLNTDNSNLKLTCITCHNPHVSVKKTGTEIFNTSCKNCHQQNTCKDPEVIKNLNTANCVECHMPTSGTLDIPHVTVHDHKIAVHKKTKPIKNDTNLKLTKEFLGLYAVNNSNPSAHSKAQAYLNYFEKFYGNQPGVLDSAKLYINKSNKLKNDLWVHYYYLSNQYSEIINIVNSNPDYPFQSWNLYRIGQAYLNLADYNNAEKWLNKAYNKEPNNIEFKFKYANSLFAISSIDEAKNQYLELLDLYPKHVASLNNLGHIYFLESDLQNATNYFNKALNLDPDYIPALLNKIRVYVKINKIVEAKKILEKILKSQPNQTEALQMLKELNS